MDVFKLRDRLIADYGEYVRGFVHVRDGRIAALVEQGLTAGQLWPDPLLQLNPAFEAGESIDELTDAKSLHPECRRILP